MAFSRKKSNQSAKQQDAVIQITGNGLPPASELVETHMALVRQIARKYSQYQPDGFEDLVQVGSIGLLKAIKYYDPHRLRTASFRTLATCYIRGEIRHYLRDHCSLVQVPRRLTEMNSQLSQLEERLTKVLDRSPTVHELSEHSGFSVQDVLEAQQSWEARNHYESLDYGEEDEREDRRSLSEVVPDKRYQDSFVASEERELVIQALKSLGDRTRQIIEFVFFYDLSQKETAYVLGLSEMGVSRAVHSALKKLKEMVNSPQMDAAMQILEAKQEREQELGRDSEKKGESEAEAIKKPRQISNDSQDKKIA